MSDLDEWIEHQRNLVGTAAYQKADKIEIDAFYALLDLAISIQKTLTPLLGEKDELDN